MANETHSAPQSPAPERHRTICSTATHDAIRATPAAWQSLPYVGQQDSETDDGTPCVLELRNCDCGSTLAIELTDDSDHGAESFVDCVRDESASARWSL